MKNTVGLDKAAKRVFDFTFDNFYVKLHPKNINFSVPNETHFGLDTLAHSQREKQSLLAMLFSTSKGEISKSKSKSLDFAIAFPLGGGTCSTLALLQFEKIVLKAIFCLDCSILVLI